jgi:oxygen-independent coproporphyrinogen-3 oxidase
VQSFDAAQLKKLGRIHDPAQARNAVTVARAAGFDNLNLDLMYALPQQDCAGAEADLRAAFELSPEHLSWYQLTLEPNTEFAKRPPPLPDDDESWTIQEAGRALLAERGYAPYEVSAYARPGRQARHNRNYWEFGDYLGFGAGAHGKRTAGTAIQRRARVKQPRAYLEAAGSAAALAEDRLIPPAELPFEFMLNALRLDAGFAPELFETRTGLPLSTIAPVLELAQQRGLLQCDAASIRTTAQGRAHLNTLLGEFLA